MSPFRLISAETLLLLVYSLKLLQKSPFALILSRNIAVCFLLGPWTWVLSPGSPSWWLESCRVGAARGGCVARGSTRSPAPACAQARCAVLGAGCTQVPGCSDVMPAPMPPGGGLGKLVFHMVFSNGCQPGNSTGVDLGRLRKSRE